MERTKQKKHSKSRYYTRSLVHYTKRNRTFLTLAVIFLSGILAGTLLLRSSSPEIQELLLRMVNGYVEKRSAQPLTENFLSGAYSAMVFVLILFFCGFCAIAQPVELAIPFCRGLGYGFSIGSLYLDHGTRAIGFSALYLMPGIFLSSIAMLLCCIESVRLSNSFLRSVRAVEERKREVYPLRIYLARYIAASFLCLFAALLEAVLYALFAKKVFLG